MKKIINIGICLLSAVAAVMVAGCGSHDQNSATPAGSSQGTPAEIVQNSKKQQAEMQNHLPSTSSSAPGHTPGAYVPPGH